MVKKVPRNPDLLILISDNQGFTLKYPIFVVRYEVEAASATMGK